MFLEISVLNLSLYTRVFENRLLHLTWVPFPMASKYLEKYEQEKSGELLLFYLNFNFLTRIPSKMQHFPYLKLN